MILYFLFFTSPSCQKLFNIRMYSMLMISNSFMYLIVLFILQNFIQLIENVADYQTIGTWYNGTLNLTRWCISFYRKLESKPQFDQHKDGLFESLDLMLIVRGFFSKERRTHLVSMFSIILRHMKILTKNLQPPSK